ncbi:MAG TPA: phosphotransferase [Kofleriaceae bacterium]|jgi:aminoglycoside phosphotransferase
MNPEACLPPALRGATLTKIAMGQSGAGVYRVESNGTAYVLKISSDKDLATAPFETKLAMQTAASELGIAPRVIHVDHDRRAVLSELVEDRHFMMLWGNPATRERALQIIASTLSRLHALPIPAGAKTTDPRAMAAHLRDTVKRFMIPPWAREVIDTAIATEPPPDDSRVLSHNDVNPTNFRFDGERLVLLDWDTVGPNDRYYDLASVALWFRMDDATCCALLSAHDGTAVSSLPARFVYDRKFIAAMCGTGFLFGAKSIGHPGDPTTPRIPLADVYTKLRAGQLDPTSLDGRWMFAMGLLDEASRL